MIREKRRRKRGSYRAKHRNNVTRWHENIVQELRRIQRATARFYATVEALMKAEESATKKKGRKSK